MSFSFVTALYNINRDKYDGRNYKQYQEWFSKTLLVPVPMIIYTEEENRTTSRGIQSCMGVQ